MIKNFFAYKNDKVGFFCDPFALPYNDENEVRELAARAVKTGQIERPEELSLYHVFSLNDKTGDVVPNVAFIVSLSEFIENGK